MERHIELTQIAADLNRKIADAEALAKAPNVEDQRRGMQLLNELSPKLSEAMKELRATIIAQGEQFKKELEQEPQLDPPPLSAGTIARLELLFSPADQPGAREVLLHFLDERFCNRPAEVERVRFAALKVSGGSLARLVKAIETANGDYRDLLIEASFASDAKQHLGWWPGQPITAP